MMAELDRYENECLPDISLSTRNIAFDEVRYFQAQSKSITVSNMGKVENCILLISAVILTSFIKKVIANFRFIPKLDDSEFCKPWLWVQPCEGSLLPGLFLYRISSVSFAKLGSGESTEIVVTVFCDRETIAAFAKVGEALEDILVLHLDSGKDLFVGAANFVWSSI